VTVWTPPPYDPRDADPLVVEDPMVAAEDQVAREDAAYDAGFEAAGAGRPGLLGLLLAAILVFAFGLIVGLAIASATPRPAPEPAIPADGRTAPKGTSSGNLAQGLIGAPHVVSPMAGPPEGPSAAAAAGDGSGAP
jgi:hypothetical protein